MRIANLPRIRQSLANIKFPCFCKRSPRKKSGDFDKTGESGENLQSLEFKLVGQGAPLKVASPLSAFLVNQKGVGAATTNFYRFSSLE